MPDLSTLDDGDGLDAPAYDMSGNISMVDQNAMAARRSGTAYSPFTTIMGDIAMGPLDLVDTVASSVPLFGTNRGEVNAAALRALDMPGLSQFYNDNRGGIEIASGIQGVILSDLLAKKITKPAGLLMRGISKLPYLAKVATLDASYAAALNVVRNVDRGLAAKGALGVEQYVGKSLVDGAIVARNTAVTRAKTLGFLVGARQAVATEAVMGATLNQNSFLYDDSASHNLMWMGLGVATGGAAEWLHGAYQIRKFVNSDEVRRAMAGALDPDAIEEARLIWGKDFSKKSAALLDGGDGAGTFLGGRFTDRVTSLLTGATTLVEQPIKGLGEDARTLMQNRTSIATQHREQARMEIQKVTTRGISTDGRTRFSMDSSGYGNHLDMMLYRDPGAMYGAEMIGGIPSDSSVFKVSESHAARTNERIAEVEAKLADPDIKPEDAEALMKLRKRLDFEKNLTPMAAIDGELMPISEAAAIEGFVEPEIQFIRGGGIEDETLKASGNKDKHGLWTTRTENPAGDVTLDSNLIFHLPGRKTLDNADHFDILRLYRLAQRALPELGKFEGPIILPSKPNWFQLDMAEQVLRDTGGRANVQFPKGMTRESAQVESLVQKAVALKKWDAAESAKALKAAAKGQPYEAGVSKLRVRYNLPKLTAYERGVLGETDSPVEKLMRGIGEYGPDEVRKMTLADVKQGVADYKRIGDIAPTTAADVDSLYGNSFKYMMDESGKPIKPLIVYKRPLKPIEWNKEYLAERMAAQKIQTVGTLTAREADPMIRDVVATTMNSADFNTAAMAHELGDVQIQGSITGVAPQNPFGALRNSVVTSEWRDRDSPILLAATRLREGIQRSVRDYMKVTVETAMGDNLNLLRNPRNGASKLLLDQFHSYRSGWEIMAKPQQREGGFWAFELANTQANRDRWAKTVGGEMPEGQTLLSPKGQEVVLDDLALDTQQRFNAVTEKIRQAKNTLLRANGQGEINSIPYYTPPPNTRGKYMGFTLGPDNKVVPGLTVIEDSPEAFAKSRAALMPELDKLGLGYVFRTQDEIRDFATIWDRAEMAFIDPGTTAIQPGKVSTGKLTGREVKVNAFDEALLHVRNQFNDLADDVIQTLFKEQINSAKARANIAGEMTRNNEAASRALQNRSIYDFYLENLTGAPKLNSQKSWVGRVYNSIEGTLDKYLEAGTPGVSRIWNATNEWVNKIKPWDSSASAKKDFNTLSQKLGPYMPFKDVTEMLERQGAGALPPTLAGMTGKLNQFTAAMMLRVMEVGQPIMNLTGILNASPSVIRHLTPRQGESTLDFASRVGHSASIFNLADGSSVGVLDMGKISARAFKRAWSRSSEADFDYMVRQGFLSQEVAEFQRQFGAIQGKSEWHKFFTGDPSAKGFKSKGLVGWLSVLSDKSEDFSRSWGHMIGLEVADVLGITNREARHAYAHDVANKMIANYQPHNRPEIFQGAIGANLGLFQSFALAYYQRLFRYVETKDYGSLATQYAMQAGFFGTVGVPGWKQFNQLMTGANGEGDPQSGIWHNFGPGAGDIIGNGVISNLPKIFGVEGVDLYSRGDINPRIPGLGSSTGNPLDAIPGTAMLRKLWQGVAEGMSLFRGDNPALSPTQFAEVASNAIANRPIAGMIEQFFAGGKDTDHYGQLVTDTKSAMETAYRMIGLRSMRQSNELNAFYANKNMQEQQAAMQETLRIATRAAMREGNFDALPKIFETYVNKGGDPRYFRRWLKNNYEAATQTRGERQLNDMLNNEGDMGGVMRLLDMGVEVGDEEGADVNAYQTSDPADELEQPNTDLGTYTNQLTTDPQ